MKTFNKYFALILIALPGIIVAGNRTDSTDTEKALKPLHRNTIKFNPTPMLFWSEMRNLTFSYERVLNPKQSCSFQAGYLVFPEVIGDSVAGIIALTDRYKYGINIAVDYRFYPLSRNRRPIPDGMYIGPYASYYGNWFSNHFNILNTTVDQNGAAKANIQIFNLGFELGYQFIFWKRLSLDLLLFGPSVSYYIADLKISGDLDPSQIDDIDMETVQKIFDKFPAIETLFTKGELSKSGFRSKLGVGFRYSIQIGFHF